MLKYVFTYLGCPKQGRYGENCSISCPENCLDSVCHNVNGTCFGCAMGYKETMCDQGWFL